MDYFTLITFNVLPVVILCILNSRLIVTLWRIVDRDLKTRGSFTSDDVDVDNTNSRTITATATTTTTTIIRSNNVVIENAALVTVSGISVFVEQIKNRIRMQSKLFEQSLEDDRLFFFNFQKESFTFCPIQ